MNHRQTVQLEPFAEVTGDAAYRFGYRTIGTDDCLSAIEVPTSTVEQAVLTRASLATRVAPDGTVISYISMSHVRGYIPNVPTDAASIEALVQRAISAENLRMEEATVGDLSTLLRKLEDSVRLVKDTIRQITSDEGHTSR